MANTNRSNLMVYLLLFIVGVMVIPMLSSCGKGQGISSSNNNARLGIVNLSLDALPVRLYARFITQGTTTYSYPSAAGYTLINVADVPIQIRTSQTSNNTVPTNLLTLDSPLVRNTPYTLFIMGLRSDSSLAAVLTVDTSSLPGNGRGKIRFVNGISNVPSGINVTLNGSTAFGKTAFKAVTDYIEVTAGSYDISLAPGNNPTQLIKTLPNFTVLDGKAYTVFSYGRSSATNDSAAYGLNTILNTLPPNTRY